MASNTLSVPSMPAGSRLSVPGESKFKEIMNQHQPSMNSLWEASSVRKTSVTPSVNSVTASSLDGGQKDITSLGINEKKIIRKIDWSILPIMFCAYFLQFLDKVVYNVSYQDFQNCNYCDRETHSFYSTQMSWAFSKICI
jgi:hypothetical protein